MTSYKQAMSVNAVRSTRYKSAIVFTIHYLQRLGIFRFNNQNLVDLIAQYLIQYTQAEYIAFLKSVEMGKNFALGRPR